MKNINIFSKVALILLSLYIGNMALPYQAYAQLNPVTVAETQINNYFAAVLAGTITPTPQSAQNFISSILQTLPTAAEQQTVYAYYEQSAVTTAETQISKYFSAVTAGTITPTPQSAQSFVNTTMAPVLVQADQQAVYANYEKTAVSTAEAQIAKFFSAITAGTITPTPQSAQSFVNTTMAPVLAQPDQQTVYTNYEQTAVTTAEGQIAKYFSAVTAGTITPTPQSAQSFVNTTMAPVLAQADQQAVYANYEKTAVMTAEGQIAKFFSAVTAGTITPTAQSAQSFVNTTMAPVLAQADQQAVYTNYEQTAVTTAEGQIAKFFSAVTAGTITPTAQSAQSFVNTTMAPVLAQADQQAVYTNYEQTAVTTAEGQIAKFFSAVTAGTITPTAQSAQSFVNTTMAPVLAQADQQTVYSNYEKSAVNTAEGQIAKFFSAVAAGTVTPTAQSAQMFINTTMAPVLAQADQQAVYTNYEQTAVSTAEAQIAKYFTAVAAGTINPTAQSAQSFVNTTIAPVLAQADQQAVYTNYEQTAVTTAEGLITKYFTAVAAGTVTPTAQSAQMFINTTMAPVLAQADQQAVYTNYEKIAVSTAEAQIAKFFSAVAAGTITPTAQSAQSFVNTTMAPVLAQPDQQAVYTNYEQTAVTTAEGLITKYFTAVAAGTVTPTAQSAQMFINTTMAPVLAQADQQAVYTNYEKTAVTTAEGQVTKYFTAVAAGTVAPTAQSAQSFVNTIMAPVLAQADQQAVYTNYEQTAVTTAEGLITKYFSAVAAGTVTPTAQSAQMFINSTMAPVLAQADQQAVYTNYEKTAVTTAEGLITKYFTAVAAGTVAPTAQSAQSFVNTTMAPVLAQPDQQTVYTNYEQTAVTTAEGLITKYFTAVAAGTVTPTAQSAQMFINTTMAPVLAQADQQAVYTNYEQTAVSTAEAQIAKYFTAVAAGTINPTAQSAQSFVNTTIAPVLAQADQQAVYTNYEQTAVTTAEGLITKYFTAVAAGTVTPTAQSAQMFINTTMAPVLAQADQQAVYTNYEQTAVSTAEAQIAKYFTAVAAGTINPTAQSAQSFVNTTMAPVLAQADQQAVYTKYEQTAVTTAEGLITKYFTAIAAGTITPTAQSAQMFLNTTMAPVLAQADMQTVSVFYNQNALNTAETAIQNYFLSVLNNASSQVIATNKQIMAAAIAAVINPADQKTVNSFYTAFNIFVQNHNLTDLNAPPSMLGYQPVVAIEPNDMFLASPQDQSGGLVYEYTQTNGVWSTKPAAIIQGLNVHPGDNFGTAMAVDGNFLAIANSPIPSSSSKASPATVYIFTKVNNSWEQEEEINLPGTSLPSLVTGLALDNETLVVSVLGVGTQAHTVQVFQRAQSGTLVQWQNIYTFTPTPTMVNFGASVAIAGPYIAIGAPNLTGNKSSSSQVMVYLQSGSTWNLNAIFSNTSNGFGQQVGIGSFSPTVCTSTSSQACTQYSVVVGAQSGQSLDPGAVYSYSQTTSSTGKTSWNQTPQALPVFIPPSIGVANIGQQITVKGNRLAVQILGQLGANMQPLYPIPVWGSLYVLDQASQWDWYGTVSSNLWGPIAINGDFLADGISTLPATDGKTETANGVEVLSPNSNFTCIGADPANSSFCPGSQVDLTQNMPITLSAGCSQIAPPNTPKCVVTCNKGYQINSTGNACVTTPISSLANTTAS